jgi:hypothetical protein
VNTTAGRTVRSAQPRSARRRGSPLRIPLGQAAAEFPDNRETVAIAAEGLALVSGIVMQRMGYPDAAPSPEAIAAGLRGIVATLD